MSGLAQWWPARTHTASSSTTWEMSCGVDALEEERDRTAAHRGVARAVDREVVAEALVERVERVAGEGHLVLADGVHAERLEVVDRGAEADGLGDRRRAGLELPGHVVGREAVVGDAA